jgi:outer membrane protein assembly factor BamB
VKEDAVTHRPLFALLCLPLVAAGARADNWPCWRGGPGGTGVAAGEKSLPVAWSADKGVRWKAAVPGAGVSAPVVWGERVFLTSSDGRENDRLHLFCYHRDTGRLLWRRRFFGSAVSEGQFAPGGMAVPTPATDGKRVYALFGTGDLVCVDMDGKPLWLRSLAKEYGPFRNRWGMAASPLPLPGGPLVVQVDHYGGSYLLAVDPATGANRWRTQRPDTFVNWSSPVSVVAGRHYVVTASSQTLTGFDAKTGRKVWSVPGLHEQCIPTPVVRGERIYLGGGADFTSLCLSVGPGPELSVRVREVWKAPSRGLRIPSPLLLGDYYYFAEDAGWISCLKADTGEKVWRQRLGSKVQASPVAGAGQLYVAGVGGTVTVLRAGPTFKVLARNDLGESVVASPALSQGRIFLRGEKHLFCVGPG